jgi:tetratricopeptide (TPR) repeat protein
LLEVVGLFGLSITIWSRWPLWAKLLAAYATGICYVGLVLTASRGGYLSAAASLIVFGLLSFDILRAAGAKLFLRIGAPIFALAVLVSVATLFLVHESEYLSDRARKVIDNKNVRLDFWQASIQQWKLSPVVGTGSRTYLYYGRKFRTPEVQFDPVFVHNDYLQLLGEYGLVGLAAFVAFLFAHLRRGWLNARRLGPKRIALSHSFASNAMALNLAALSAVAAYLVHSIFDFNLHIPANALLLAFAFGILANSAAARSTMEPGSDKSSIFWRTLPWALALFLAVQIWRLGPGEYYAERARAELRDLRFLSAISYALKALDHEKENPALYYYLGRARFQAGDRQTEPEARASFYRAALSAYGEALKLAPLDETYMLELAFTYDALQRFPEAEWMYYEALAFDPKSASARRYYEVHLERWRNGGISPEPVAAEVPQSSW